MIVTVTFVGLLAMLFASLPKRIFRYGLEVAWLIIFVFLAIRYDFGNDYMNYLDNFNLINSWIDFKVDKDLHSEPCWQILCYLFKPFGFFAMVACLTAFECYVIYRLIKKYVPERYYWFSMFLFVFTPSMMLIGASMMRQMLAITLVVCSVRYITERKLIPFVILIFLASQIHSSATIMYPLFLLGYIREMRMNKWIGILIIIAYVALSSVSDQLAPFINEIAIFTGEDMSMEYYTEKAVFHEGSGYGNLLQMFIFAYLVFTLHKYGGSLRLLFLLLVMGTFVKPFATQVPLIDRYAYYFNIFSVACYPIIWGGSKEYSQMGYKLHMIISKKRILDFAIICVIVMTTLYEYVQFFKSPVWIDKFSTYYTIFMV